MACKLAQELHKVAHRLSEQMKDTSLSPVARAGVQAEARAAVVSMHCIGYLAACDGKSQPAFANACHVKADLVWSTRSANADDDTS